VERGNAKHSPREDDMLSAALSGSLGRGGSNREEWVDPEGPADDDAPARSGPPVEELPIGGEPDPSPDGRSDVRAQHDMDVANDWHES
jgi:hypothetical protein